jgi:hypothetical protein
MKRTQLFLMACLLGLSSLARAEEPCGAEIKLLLVPGETQTAVNVLHVGAGKTGQTFLYDTGTLDLLARGVVVRVRAGATADLMVKVRIPLDKTMSGLSDVDKCEVDRSGDTAVRSYSITNPLDGKVPQSGEEVLRLLTPAQKQLLQQAKVSPAWSRVERLASIDSTVWQTKNEVGLGKLTLEQWRWPTGEVLELSTKAADDAAAIEAQLKELVTRRGLAISPTQKLKTEVVLRDVTHTSAP